MKLKSARLHYPLSGMHPSALFSKSSKSGVSFMLERIVHI